MPASKMYKCGVCKENVTKTQSSIQCSICKLWIHLPCADMSEKHLALFKEKPQVFNFTCCNCGEDSARSISEEIRSLKGSFDTFSKSILESNTSFRDSMIELLNEFKRETSTCIRDIKSDIAACNERVSDLDTSTSKKVCDLQHENHVLHRRLNRADILITGLPLGMSDLSTPILSLCSFYRCKVSEVNINSVSYLKKNILVKFNNVGVRDQIMKEYFKSKSLLVKDLIGGDIASRVYLNEHYSPAASNLNSICRKLLRSKVIRKFKILNMDVLKAKIALNDSSVVTYGVAECAELLNKSSGPVK